jgi:ABC-2 type transport system permease protein
MLAVVGGALIEASATVAIAGVAVRVTPAVGGLLFALAYRFWRRQLRHYQGVGH